MAYSKEIQDAVRSIAAAKGFDGATVTITRKGSTHQAGLVYAKKAGTRTKTFLGGVEQLLREQAPNGD